MYSKRIIGAAVDRPASGTADTDSEGRANVDAPTDGDRTARLRAIATDDRAGRDIVCRRRGNYPTGWGGARRHVLQDVQEQQGLWRLMHRSQPNLPQGCRLRLRRAVAVGARS